jgi:1,6-anhydro-N-acetylmuramate kinase
MARHTRHVPRNRHDREQATKRAGALLDQLGHQANEVRQLEAAARRARTRLQDQILHHIDARELDITDMAKATGISRQTIHRLQRSRNTRPAEIVPEWVIGQRVVHRARGAGTIEQADGSALTIWFDNGQRSELHARLAGIKPM